MLVYHFTESRWALDDIRKMRLKIARINNLNDPFDFFVHIMSPDRADYRDLRERFNDSFGLLCFSETYRDPVQWAHYANNHSGIVLAFEVNDDLLNQVQYRDFPHTVYFTDYRGKDDEWGEVYSTLCDKYINWQYEREQRLIIELKDAQEEIVNGEKLHFRSFGSGMDLKEVIIGLANQESPDMLIEALSENRSHFQGVKVFKTNINESEYRVQKGIFIERL